VGVCICMFCNVWVCVCVCSVMCGFCNVCVYMYPVSGRGLFLPDSFALHVPVLTAIATLVSGRMLLATPKLKSVHVTQQGLDTGIV
jgi:hypothetical protein